METLTSAAARTLTCMNKVAFFCLVGCTRAPIKTSPTPAGEDEPSSPPPPHLRCGPSARTVASTSGWA